MGRKCPDMRTVAIKRVLLCERFQKEQKQRNDKHVSYWASAIF